VDDPFSVGGFLPAKPQELQRKAKFGSQGSILGSQLTDLDEMRT
jgi:hypothetical protein